MKLWPTDPEHRDGDGYVTAVVVLLTIAGIVFAWLVWGRS